ncbi:MAG: flagellar biosynthesis protein FlgN [Planctomycetota bacterium]
MNQDSHLETWIEKRFELLSGLLDLTTHQEAAIEAGQMNELMQILGEKSRWLRPLLEVSQSISDARRNQTTPANISSQHRSQHQRAEEMHAELLQRESACESALVSSRQSLSEALTQTSSSRHAAKQYRQPESPARGSLDLSQ